MDRDEAPMRFEAGFRARRRRREPAGEVAHQRRYLGGRGEHERRAGDRPLVPAIAPSLLGVDTRHDQPMDLAHIDLTYPLAGGSEGADEGKGIAMTNRFEMVLQRLA